MSIRIGENVIATKGTKNRATTEELGLIQLATDAEVEQGEDNTKAITPNQLSRAKVKTDNETVEIGSNGLEVIGTIEKNDNNILCDWVGTEAEYTAAWNAGLIESNWICWITDDNSDGSSSQVDQTYDPTSTHAQSGVAIAGAEFLQNTATGSESLTIGGTSTNGLWDTNIGVDSRIHTSALFNRTEANVAVGHAAQVSGNFSLAIGAHTEVEGMNNIAIGAAAKATTTSSSYSHIYQIGEGTNTTPMSLAVGFGGSSNDQKEYILLYGDSGIIPDERLSPGIERVPIVTGLTSSGTINLLDGNIYIITPTGNVTFSLPNPINLSPARFHQIVVQINLNTLVSINVGTSYYFNREAPDFSEAGTYNLIYELDNNMMYWVCGAVIKGAAN